MSHCLLLSVSASKQTLQMQLYIAPVSDPTAWVIVSSTYVSTVGWRRLPPRQSSLPPLLLQSAPPPPSPSAVPSRPMSPGAALLHDHPFVVRHRATAAAKAQGAARSSGRQLRVLLLGDAQAYDGMKAHLVGQVRQLRGAGHVVTYLNTVCSVQDGEWAVPRRGMATGFPLACLDVLTFTAVVGVPH